MWALFLLYIPSESGQCFVDLPYEKKYCFYPITTGI